MKKYSILYPRPFKVGYYLLISCLILVLNSCSNENLQQIDEKIDNEKITLQHTDYENKLMELSQIFGEVFLDKAAREEFYESSIKEINDGQAQMSLKKLFEGDAQMRKSSPIANAFQSGKLRTLRSQEESDDWVNFIKSNDIKIIAPYLAENFKLEEINELTVSWWTEEMELPYVNDHNWKGETPGIKINMNNPDFVSDISLGDISSYEKVTANDDYAKVNPTIVLGNFEMPDDLSNSKLNTANLNWLPPTVNPFRCFELTSGALFTLRSPQFNLTSNTRGWPNTNYIYMWVINGDVEYESNGFPKPKRNIEMVLNKKQVTRSQVPNAWIEGNSFLIQNWKFNSDDIAIVWGYFDRNSSLKISGEVKVSDSGAPSGSLKAEYEIDEGDKKLMSHQNFDKCVMLENNYWSINQGNGFVTLPKDIIVSIHNYPIYKMGTIKFYFTTSLSKEI